MKRPFYNAVQSLLHDRRYFISALCVRFGFLFSDERYLKTRYRLIFRKPLDLNNPVSYSEKLQWLKLYYHRPEFTAMADKVKVKQYVAERIGEEYVVPLLGVWDKPEHIEWEKLPKKFVLKTNHDGGNYGVVICRNIETFDKKKAIKRLRKSLKRDTFLLGREWPYKNIERKVFAEQYIEDDAVDDLPEYKFFCFDGKAKMVNVVTERQSPSGVKFDYFDEHFNHLDLKNEYPHAAKPPKKSESFDLMKSLAEEMSVGIPDVRVDFFEAGGRVYFSEFTFFNGGGLVVFQPQEYDYTLGQYIQLPEKYGI